MAIASDSVFSNIIINSSIGHDSSSIMISAAPGDYRTVAENIYLSSSVSEACVVVEIQDDSAVESTEYLTVSLSSLLAGQALELDPNTTTIYITDNDSKCNLIV